MSAVGKTIARIEEQPTDPEYGYARDDTLIIHFTDGTAMSVHGSSYEEVSLGYNDELDAADVRKYAQAAAGRREKERLARLEREEWESLTDEERARRTAERRAKMSPMARMMEDMERQLIEDMRSSMNRGLFCQTGEVTLSADLVGRSFTIPVAPKRKRARRS